MPRILIAGFGAVPGPDRIGVQLRHIIRALARHHTVDVLAVRRGDQAYVEKLDNARVLRVPVPDGPISGRVDAFRRALCRQLEGADYDVVQFRDGWSAVPVLEMQRRLRFAAVFDAGRSPLAEPPMYGHETAAALERDEAEGIRRADLILAATEPGRLHLASLVPPERVHLVPPGVDVDAFDWDEPTPGPPRILYAGALAPGRGVRVLLRAMLDVAAQSEAQLGLAGRATPEFFASLEKAVRDLDLGDRVQLFGEVSHEDMAALVASATVCVAPGAIDLGARPLGLYPTKLLEYMACQRAVVAPHRETVEMLVRDEQHALLFEPGQPLDLADKVLRLLSDAELRGRLARSGYDLVRRAHTASATRRALRRAYAWLASISPWRERFAALLEEMPTGDMPALSTADPTGPAAWVGRRAAPEGDRSIAAFEADVIDDLGESVQVDTGLNEGMGEVTKVEAPPLAHEDRSSGAAYQQVATSVTRSPLDEWVVEDSRIREVPQFDGARGDRTSSTPIDSRFVAGELEVPDDRTPVEEPVPELAPDEMFSAMGPPLGLDDGAGEEQTEAGAIARLARLRGERVPPVTTFEPDRPSRVRGNPGGAGAGRGRARTRSDTTEDTAPRRAVTEPAVEPGGAVERSRRGARSGTTAPPPLPPLLPVRAAPKVKRAPAPRDRGPDSPKPGGAHPPREAAAPDGAPSSPGAAPDAAASKPSGAGTEPRTGAPTVVVGPDLQVRIGTGDDTGL